MKRLLQVGLLSLVAAVALTSAGCKTRPKNITALPGSEGKSGAGLPAGQPLPPGGNNAGGGNTATGPGNRYNPNPNPGGPVDLTPTTPANPDALTNNNELPTGNIRDGKREDREMFKGNTVYFDFDKSAVKKSEQAKVAAVAEYLKANPTSALEVEGHCDERGTEGYNLALGERRALAIRDVLLSLGVPAGSVTTVSFGEARPADPAQNEGAWSKNRRGEFVLLVPVAPASVR